MTQGADVMKKKKCEKNQWSSMSSSAQCDLNNIGDIIKLHDLCDEPKCKCQK